MTELQIRFFLAVVTNGTNFTKASEALYVSQPALSKQIAKLNAELGFKLFDTSRKNTARLTPGGQIMYQFFTECQEKFNEALLASKEANKNPSYELRIACLHNWNYTDILKIFKSFITSHPNINVSIDSLDFKPLELGLAGNKYDLVITLADHLGPNPALCIRPISTIPNILLFGAEHRLAHRKNLDICDFRDDVMYVLSPDITPASCQNAETYCKSKGFIPKIKFMPNNDSILFAIETGEGYAIFDTNLKSINNPNFRYIELDIRDTICLVWKKDNSNKALEYALETCFGERTKEKTSHPISLSITL
jgi:DNA-binding transcriptional LysR family regulator